MCAFWYYTQNAVNKWPIGESMGESMVSRHQTILLRVRTIWPCDRHVWADTRDFDTYRLCGHCVSSKGSDAQTFAPHQIDWTLTTSSSTTVLRVHVKCWYKRFPATALLVHVKCSYKLQTLPRGSYHQRGSNFIDCRQNSESNRHYIILIVLFCLP